MGYDSALLLTCSIVDRTIHSHHIFLGVSCIPLFCTIHYHLVYIGRIGLREGKVFPALNNVRSFLMARRCRSISMTPSNFRIFDYRRFFITLSLVAYIYRVMDLCHFSLIRCMHRVINDFPTVALHIVFHQIFRRNLQRHSQQLISMLLTSSRCSLIFIPRVRILTLLLTHFHSGTISEHFSIRVMRRGNLLNIVLLILVLVVFKLFIIPFVALC